MLPPLKVSPFLLHIKQILPSVMFGRYESPLDFFPLIMSSIQSSATSSGKLVADMAPHRPLLLSWIPAITRYFKVPLRSHFRCVQTPFSKPRHACSACTITQPIRTNACTFPFMANVKSSLTLGNIVSFYFPSIANVKSSCSLEKSCVILEG